MRKVKVAAASLCLLSYGMLHGGIINAEVSVAKTEASVAYMNENTAESVTTAASIETTSIVTNLTTAKTTVPARTTAKGTTCTSAASALTTTTVQSTTVPVTEATAETVTTSTAQEDPAQFLTAASDPEVTAAPDAAEAAPSTQAETTAAPECEAEVTADAAPTAITVTDREYIMLCNVVGHEYGASWVPESEKALVAEVIMNRVNSPAFPNTIYEVLMQRNQFAGLERLVKMEDFSGYVTDSVKAAVDLYLSDPSQFNHGYLYFNGDGYRNYFRTAY